jgi:hypothetical protein
MYNPIYIGGILIFIGIALLKISLTYASQQYKRLCKDKERNKKLFIVFEAIDILGMFTGEFPPIGALFPVFISILLIIGGVAIIFFM